MLIKDFKEYSRALQIATVAYNMVLHKATGFSPFQLLYGRDTLMPDKLPFTEYKSNEDYEQALNSHIETMIATNRKAMEKNQLYQDKTKR